MTRFWLPALLFLMEAGWVSGLAAVVARLIGPQDAGPLLPLPLALLTLLAGYGAGQRIVHGGADAGDDGDGANPAGRASGRPPAAALGLGVLWAVAGTWLVRHPGSDVRWLGELPLAVASTLDRPSADALSLLGLFGLWWRGLRTGIREPTHASTVQAFGTGALALAAALLVAARSGASTGPLVAGILAFLGAGLPALSLARLEEVRADLAAGAARGQPGRLDASWWRSLLPPVALVLGVGTTAAVLLAEPHVRDAVLGAAGAAGELVLGVLYWPLLLVGFLAEWLVYFLRQFTREPQQQISPPAAPGDWRDLLGQLRSAEYQTAPWLQHARWVVLAVGAALVALAFWRSARGVRREAGAAPAAVADRETLGFWGALWADVRKGLAALLRRLGQRTAALAAGPRSAAAGERRADGEHTADVRSAYRRLLALGRQHELIRPPHETPGEYLGRWRETLPGEPEAARLTHAYARARYGPPPAPHEPAEVLRSLLQRLQAALEAWRREQEQERLRVRQRAPQ